LKPVPFLCAKEAEKRSKNKPLTKSLIHFAGSACDSVRIDGGLISGDAIIGMMPHRHTGRAGMQKEFVKKVRVSWPVS
jgi:hypothetical protein